MSTPFGRSVLVAAALAALLSGCAAPAPAAAPEPPATPATTPSAEPEPPAEFACADLSDAVPDGFQAADPFGDAFLLATVAAGGSSCVWWPGMGGGEIWRIVVTLLPEGMVESPAFIEPQCGELYNSGPACFSRETVDGLVAETLIQGDIAAAETSSVLETVASALRERLVEGARFGAGAESPTNRIDCQSLVLSATSLPEAVGSFVGEFGGTDSGAPASELASIAMASMDGQIGCITATASGFGVTMFSLGRGAELLDDPRVVGASAPLQFADGREARILVGTTPAVHDDTAREFARVAFEVDGSLVFLSIFDGSTSPDAASIDEAATAIAEAIAAAIDARA